MVSTTKSFHLIFSLDYELFGDGSGCLTHCVRDPTERCAKILESHDAKLSLFVETLEFIALRDNAIPDYQLIEDQLKSLSERGHEFALHLHPQWMVAQPDRESWQLAFDRWRIGDLQPEDTSAIIADGYKYLTEILGPAAPISTFRAGGWCIQPGSSLPEQISKAGMTMDSTVAPGAWNAASGDWFDFRKSPDLPYWRIESDVCQEVSSGSIIEVPIATDWIGRINHFRALLESKRAGGFPEGCQGSYDGPNSRWQALMGKASKILSMGRVMLDFSSLPSEQLISITEAYMARFKSWQHPVPIVAIAHNKNFTQRSEQSLKTYLEWVDQQPQLKPSSYTRWFDAHNKQR